MIFNLLNSVDLLTDTMISFSEHCLKGLRANREKIDSYVEQCLMLVTALNEHIGYDKAAAIAKKANKEGTTLKAAALSLGYLTEEEFARFVVPERMTRP